MPLTPLLEIAEMMRRWRVHEDNKLFNHRPFEQPIYQPVRTRLGTESDPIKAGGRASPDPEHQIKPFGRQTELRRIP